MGRHRSVAGVAFDDEGRVLIGKRKSGGSLSQKWEFPGGKLEPGEEPEHALRREFLEELGVDIAVGPCAASAEFSHNGTPFTLEAYVVTLQSHRFQLREHETVAWVESERLEQYDLADSDRQLLPKLAATPRPPVRRSKR